MAAPGEGDSRARRAQTQLCRRSHAACAGLLRLRRALRHVASAALPLHAGACGGGRRRSQLGLPRRGPVVPVGVAGRRLAPHGRCDGARRARGRARDSRVARGPVAARRRRQSLHRHRWHHAHGVDGPRAVALPAPRRSVRAAANPRARAAALPHVVFEVDDAVCADGEPGAVCGDRSAAGARRAGRAGRERLRRGAVRRVVLDLLSGALVSTVVHV